MKTRLLLAVCVAAALVVAVSGPVSGTPGSATGYMAISREPAFPTPCTTQLPFSAFDPEAEFQPQVAVHPRDPEQLAVVWTQGTFVSAVVGISNNGGKTWEQVHVPISRCSGGLGGFAGDPWITWASDGTLHLAALTLPQAAPPATQIVVTRSGDGGRTWTTPVIVETDDLLNDREALAVDPAEPNRLYLAWTQKLADGTFAIAVARSRDKGATWTPSRRIHHSARGFWPSGLSVVVLRDGTVLAAFEELLEGTPHAKELVLRSTDQGETWNVIPVAETRGSWPRHPETGTEAIGNAAPTIDVAPDGGVVLAWQDIDLREEGESRDTASILFARSEDGGLTWTRPVQVRSGPGQAWGPTIAAGAEGTVAVTWYDTRRDREGDDQWTGEVFAAHAHDGGLGRWHETRLAGPFDLLKAFYAFGPYVTLGNYFGLRPMGRDYAAAFSVPASDAAEAPQDIVFAKLTLPPEKD